MRQNIARPSGYWRATLGGPGAANRPFKNLYGKLIGISKQKRMSKQVETKLSHRVAIVTQHTTIILYFAVCDSFAYFRPNMGLSGMTPIQKF